MNLIEKYGQYTIKKGTKLFRISESTSISKEMFFAFSPDGTSNPKNSSYQIQIWETLVDTNGFLMLTDSSKNKKISAVIEIYNQFFPNEKISDYLDIKHFSKERSKLIMSLKSKGINNWICSVENKYDMEFFLFDSVEYNSNCIAYIEAFNSKYKNCDTFNHSLIKYSV